MRALLLIPALLLAGCHKEQSFDERYNAAAKAIRDKAKSIDADMTAREKLQSEAAAAAPTTAPSATAGKP